MQSYAMSWTPLRNEFVKRVPLYFAEIKSCLRNDNNGESVKVWNVDVLQVTVMAVSCKGLFECIKSLNIAQVHKRGFIFIILLLLFYTCTGKYVKDNNFDYLIFSQRWLPTACIEYIEKNSISVNPHFCTLSKNFKSWRIHGLWPTQDNTLGPFFCNRSMPFDIYKLKSIETDLELYWPNIEGGKSIDSLWRHEWEKHGTCAAQLESLNDELKYFNKSLTIYKTHNMQEIFTKNNILPSNKGIHIYDLFYVLKNTVGKVPQVHCIHEVKTKLPYLSEIRLCYNKNLELIDCKHMQISSFNSGQSFISGLTNCPNDKNIIIPDNIYPGLKNETAIKINKKLENYNKFYVSLLVLRFLQWVSI